MSTRAELVALVRVMLGTTSDDPMYPDTTLNPIVQQAVDGLLQAIHDANPAYLSKTVTLAADAPDGFTYSFATQSAAIADFARWLEVRYTDQDGAPLHYGRLEEHGRLGSGYFDVVGTDDLAQLIMSSGTGTGRALWMRYAYWPALLASDTDVPSGIPVRYHDVIALEALFAFGLGGEENRAPELTQRWIDRRAQLMVHVSRRGTEPKRTRMFGDVSREC